MKSFICSVIKYFLLSIIPFSVLAALTAYYAVDVPFWDEWEIIKLLDKFYSGTMTLSDIFAQHNDHRIIFTKIIMLLNAIYLGWNNYINMAVVLLFAVGTSLVIYYSVQQLKIISDSGSTWKKDLLYFTFACLIFSFTQYEIWLWGFEMQLSMNVFFTMLTLVLLAYGKGLIIFVTALIFALLATFSFANGMFVWPAGLLIIAGVNYINYISGKKFDYLKVFSWLLTGTLGIYLYFSSGYIFLIKTETALTFERIYVFIRDFVCFLGSPIVNIKPVLAFGAGLSGLAIYFYCLFMIAKYKIWDENKFLWIAAVVYVFLSSAAAASGRTNGSLASRYIVFSTLFWVANLCMLFEVKEYISPLPVNHYLKIIIVILFLIFCGSRETMRAAQYSSEIKTLFLEQIKRGIYDDKVFMSGIYPFREGALRIPLLKKYGIRNFENAPDVIEFHDFDQVKINLHDLSRKNITSCEINAITKHGRNFMSIDGSWSIASFSERDRERSRIYIILYDDNDNNNAFQTELKSFHIDNTLSGRLDKNIFSSYQKSSFSGRWLYLGDLPDGKYNAVIKVAADDGTEYFFKLRDSVL